MKQKVAEIKFRAVQFCEWSGDEGDTPEHFTVECSMSPTIMHMGSQVSELSMRQMLMDYVSGKLK